MIDRSGTRARSLWLLAALAVYASADFFAITGVLDEPSESRWPVVGFFCMLGPLLALVFVVPASLGGGRERYFHPVVVIIFLIAVLGLAVGTFFVVTILPVEEVPTIGYPT